MPYTVMPRLSRAGFIWPDDGYVGFVRGITFMPAINRLKGAGIFIRDKLGWLGVLYIRGGASVVQLVARWITDHYHLSSSLGVGISEEWFIFDFASLALKVARPI